MQSITHEGKPHFPSHSLYCSNVYESFRIHVSDIGVISRTAESNDNQVNRSKIYLQLLESIESLECVNAYILDWSPVKGKIN